jgi:hypothetical protein
MAQIRFCSQAFSVALTLKLAAIAGISLGLQAPQSLLAQGIPQRWEAREYRPPAGIGAPRRREGGGTRSPEANCLASDKALTALIPDSRFGTTVAAYPTFFAFVPTLSDQALPLPVEFVLEDANANLIYQATVQVSKRSGAIITLSLPTQAGLAPLAVGRDYKWSFSISCRGNDRSGDIRVEGWVRRVALAPELEAQLELASPERQVELYAGAEIWHDALATLVRLRRDNSNNSNIASLWGDLLRAAGLDRLVREPLVPPSTSSKRR